MDDKEFRFGVEDYFNQTLLHPVGAAAILVFGCAMLFLPRRYAVIPMILSACFLSSAQRIAIFTLNFTLLRIMVVFGFARLVARGELRDLHWNPLDVALVAWALVGAATNIVLCGTGDAVKNRSGWLFDVLGTYFLCRGLIRDWDDLTTVVAAFTVISIPVALAFLVENQTERNLFSFLGGVPEVTAMREGRLRCQGAFYHPILAGCFWAVILPLIVARWWDRRTSRPLTVVGIIAVLAIIMLCASSTPVSAVLAAGVAGLAFFVRAHLRVVRWGIVFVLVSLHLFMTAPVWHLFAKIDFVGGSTGWHRYWVLDIFIRNVGDWWLLGSMNPMKWVATSGTADFLDVTNQYVLEGINGGLLTLGLFVTVIVVGFRAVGVIWRSLVDDRARLAFAWGLGVSLFVHVMNFFAVGYFGQIVVPWYLLLAAISSLTPTSSAPRSVGAWRGVGPVLRQGRTGWVLMPGTRETRHTRME